MSEPRGAEQGLARARSHVQALLDYRRYDEAARQAGRLVASHPDEPDPYGLLAAARLGQGRREDALAAADRLVALEPDGEWGHRIRAVALDGLQRHEEAVAAADRSVVLAPNLPDAHRIFAYVALDAPGWLRAAEAAAFEAVRLDPNQPEAHFVVALVAERLNEVDRARTAYERTLALDPEHALALHNLALLTGGWRLTRLAQGIAGALRLDPSVAVMRENLDWLAGRFLGRSTLLALAGLVAALATTLGGRGLDGGSRVSTASVVVAVVVPLLLAAYAWSTWLRVPDGVRRYVPPRMVRQPVLLTHVVVVAVVLVAVWVVCLVPDAAGVGIVVLRVTLLAAVLMTVVRLARRGS